MILLFLLATLPLPQLHSQSHPPADRTAQIESLFSQGQWEKVVEAVPLASSEPADLELDRGLALAQLKRWSEARQTFLAGILGYPRDPRFRVELAGVAYRQKRYDEAKKYLRGALWLEPGDAYANNFLGSIYYLEGNLEAALKYWNRAARPHLADFSFQPPPELNPLLLDRTFPFSPGMLWTRDEFLASESHLDALDLFPQRRFDLEAHPDGSFDLRVEAPIAGTWNPQRPESWLSLFRGLPYETVYPEFFNLNHSGLNWLSSFRWDDQMRRLHSELASPLFDNPSLRFRFFFDARNENWNISRTIMPSAPAPAFLNLEKLAVGAEFHFLAGPRWQWSLGAEYSDRHFRSLSGIPLQSSEFFTDGSSLSLRGGVQRSLVRFPERRFTLDSSAGAEIGTFLENPLGRYARFTGDLSAVWFLRARGDDYEFRSRLRAGGTLGRVPFDQLYMLGFDRDNDLWLRGHPDLRGGQKGNAPLGRNYILLNSDFDKILFNNGFLTLKLGPLLDTGRIYDPSGFFGSPKWLWDTGVETKIRILGSFELVLGYGKDLRSGTNSFFTTVTR
ncbi:MAG TPA: tetratricopeptide repeat protein [Verrucomicrobiae bacterium]|nr:tetratricopeptide repeat protein [Verrucomicrobiae bacterium]